MQCKFSPAWTHHKPVQDVDETGFCSLHSGLLCGCGSGRQALGECPATPGPLVCGYHYCRECDPDRHNQYRFHTVVRAEPGSTDSASTPTSE